MRILFLLLLFCGSVSAQQNDSLAIDKRQIDFDRGISLIKSNPDSVVAIARLNFHFSDLPYDTAVSFFKRIIPDLAYMKEYQQLVEKIKLGALSQIGTQIRNVPLESSSGSIFHLDTIARNHRLVLLDFWGSWCGPCRGNAKELKTFFKKFNPEGFTIVGISIEEPARQKWLRAIAEDGSQLWYQGLDASKKLQEQLGVSAVPAYILINKDMKILGRFSGRWIGLRALENAILKQLE